MQWKEQFHLWTTVDDQDIVSFTSSTTKKDMGKKPVFMDPNKACVLITTYSMMSVTKRSDQVRGLSNPSSMFLAFFSC